MKTRDFEKLLKSKGFAPLRQSGSHLVWSNGARHVTVPQRSTINKMVARRLLKEIAFDEDVAELRYVA